MYQKDKLPLDDIAEALTPIQKRQQLVRALRNRALWPVGFHWDYRDGITCALGLGQELGLLECDNADGSGCQLGFKAGDGTEIFIRAGHERGERKVLFGLVTRPVFRDLTLGEVTPKRVADVIEYIADGKLPA